MTYLNNLKIFFKALNDCTNIEEIQMIFQGLVQRPISLIIFDETLSGEKNNTDYLNKLNSDLEDFGKFIEGHPIKINKNIIYPILLKEQLIGCLEYSADNGSKTDLENLEIAVQVLALKIENLRLSGTINKSLEFNNAMKNIAKIIETQYELSYIIPIIGEILDTFVENHLVYIFLKQNGKFRLMWPGSCLDSKLSKKIVALSNTKEISFSKNKKQAYFPLVSENNVIGYIATKSTENQEITSQEVYYIQQLSQQTATTITRAKVYAEILKYATLDALTGFYNRRQLDERVKQEVSHAKRKGSSLCAIMADIDYFKHVNDTYGHTAGDLVLKSVAKVMRSQLREYDIAARYGGEEFVILLPYTNIDEAYSVAERLRKNVCEKIIDIEKVNTKNKAKSISVSISIGINEYNNTDSASELIMKADKALYKAKESGRNQIILYDNI